MKHLSHRLLALLVAAFGTLTLAGTASALNYATGCRIEGGHAKGLVRLLPPDTSTSFSGKAWFSQYDDDGDLISRDWTTVIAILIGSGLQDVDQIDAARGAKTCTFDVSEIVGAPAGADGDTHPARDYVTFCQVLDGKAHGSMKLTGARTSVSFSGKVWFTFFDHDGDQIGRDWTTAVVIVVGRDKGEVDTIDAPRDAFDCALDISEAIGG